jgi:hypothetical protein
VLNLQLDGAFVRTGRDHERFDCSSVVVIDDFIEQVNVP